MSTRIVYRGSRAQRGSGLGRTLAKGAKKFVNYVRRQAKEAADELVNGSKRRKKTGAGLPVYSGARTQLGSGLPKIVYRGSRTQRGSGLGEKLKGLIPVGVEMVKNAGKKLWNAGKEVLVGAGKSALQAGAEAGLNAVNKKVKNATQGLKNTAMETDNIPIAIGATVLGDTLENTRAQAELAYRGKRPPSPKPSTARPKQQSARSKAPARSKAKKKPPAQKRAAPPASQAPPPKKKKKSNRFLKRGKTYFD